MPELEAGHLLTESALLAEFTGPNAELARDLLHIRQPAPESLRARVLALQVAALSPVRTGRRWTRPTAVLRGLSLALLLLIGLVATVPGWRVRAVQAAQELGQMLLSLGVSSAGYVTFSPTPTFTVQQPRVLPNGWQVVGQRYAPGGGAGSSAGSATASPAGATSAEIVQHAVELKRGDFAHLVLGYTGPDDRFLILFERGTQPGETLPAGAPRSVGDQPAVLVEQAEAKTLVWVSDGTWIELESNLPEGELLSWAAQLIASQSPTPASAVGTLLPLVLTSHVILSVSLEEAQKQVMFHIPTFAMVPAGFELGGAHVDPPNWASIYYVATDPQLAEIHAGFGIGITLGVPTSEEYIGGTERQTDLNVNGHPAEYWAGPSTGALEWQADGFTYRLSFSGFELSPDELQQLAESLH